MANLSPGTRGDHNWTTTESEAAFVSIDVIGNNTTLPERLKGYRPGQRFKAPPPQPDTSPSPTSDEITLDVTFDVDCNNRTLPERLKGYRPGQRFKAPPPQPDTNPPASDDNKPAE